MIRVMKKTLAFLTVERKVFFTLVCLPRQTISGALLFPDRLSFFHILYEMPSSYDPDFPRTKQSRSRSRRFIRDAQEMMPLLSPLLNQLLQEKKPVCLLGVTLSNLVSQNELSRPDRVKRPSLWNVVGE